MEAAVEEEKRRIMEQKEEMEKSADEIREMFQAREAALKVSPLPVGLVKKCRCRGPRTSITWQHSKRDSLTGESS